MANAYNNKIALSDGTVLIDLSSDTVTAADVTSGVSFHLPDGSPATGTASGGLRMGTAQVTNSSATNLSLSFSGLLGEPVAFALVNTGNITLSSGYYYISSILYDGTNHHGTYGYYRSGGGSSRYIYAGTSYYSSTYSNGTLTVRSSASSRSAAGGAFYNTTYQLIYVY